MLFVLFTLTLFCKYCVEVSVTTLSSVIKLFVDFPAIPPMLISETAVDSTKSIKTLKFMVVLTLTILAVSALESLLLPINPPISTLLLVSPFNVLLFANFIALLLLPNALKLIFPLAKLFWIIGSSAPTLVIYPTSPPNAKVLLISFSNWEKSPIPLTSIETMSVAVES